MPQKFDLSRFTQKARKALERAQSLAQTLRHDHVDLEHTLLAMLEQDDSVAQSLLENLGANPKALGRKLIDELELLPKSYRKQEQPFVGKDLLGALQEAGELANTLGDQFTSSEHLLIAFARRSSSYAGRALRDAGATAEKLEEAVKKARGGQKITSAEGPASEILSKYAQDITAMAERGELDPVIGRDAEIRRVMQVLTRRTKNNPVLLGHPGVGKTSIVNALAQRLVAGDVPAGLAGKRLMRLDLGALVAGTSLRGQFEERIKTVVQEVVNSRGRIILFIDELHQLVGAGGKDSSMNASNMLKPALARGELSCIGTSTVEEYRQHVEADAALERRFQSIHVEEVSTDGCVSILRGIKQGFEIHHGVQIDDSALVAAAQMTARYVQDRFLPDKAIDAIDEAASRLRLEIDSKPTELDAVERRVHALEMERQAIAESTNPETVEERTELENAIESQREEAARLRVRWETEKVVLDEITTIKEEIEATEKTSQEAQRAGELGRAAEIRYSVMPKLKQKLEAAQARMSELHKEERLLKDFVDANDIGEVIADWTGIPVSKMLESEREKLLNMPDRLRQRVVGQDSAIETICSAIWRSRAGLQDRNRPIGNFMFVGPTGVGKTELAKALSEFLFDSEDAIVRIDMSEYMEQSKVNTLIGSARGYVGSEQGGVLTEAVRLKPYSVVLFDEAEKAHPDVFNLLLQLMDEGRLTDSQGRRVDFTNTLVILTSNVGSREIMDLSGKASGEEMTDAVQEILRDHFRPEFLNRLDAPIVFQALDKEAIRLIVDIQKKRLRKMLAEQRMTIEVSDEAKDFLAEEGFEPEYGARPLKRAIGTYIQDPLAVEVLEGKFGPGDHIVVKAADDGESLRFEKGQPGE
ncbi:type VI secretion system ATPase TssH [Lujinxingia litoralis]|uniref:Type VI secretion system ATPase TssH n=1 Tax=Lujinxingia litoralis TaxID=2211119 RepID=A0A328C6D9_9DELT|nr:AAA family ATPase [Lujinxingia litoralis]RAL21767.1 type VI secretion system ATPase TssH [Lujinxingia litoralis]